MNLRATSHSAALSCPKILMLHGHAQSGRTLQCKTEFLKPQVKDTILNAVQQYPNAEPVDMVEFHYPSGRLPAKVDQPPEESNYRWVWGYGDSMSDRIRGFEQSVDEIFRYMEKNGPFLGLMGFSMGAATGAMIASLLEKRHSIGNFQFNTDHPPLKFVVAICGFTLEDPLYNDFYTPKIETPIFLAIASIDVMVAESESLRLRDSCTNTTLYFFEGAHHVPRHEAFLESLNQFIENALSIKEDHEEDWEDYGDY
ncbi:Serine hydrolase FSH [Penicillium expansum]|uniref:Serine hydrolase FSH n=1 Tax=Penicillium expansum TaxID=27334 RepID=A0A0A2J6T1_PENEN|nr:Serine hydrolase FSH [Penicillium expansum]KGO50393.1 Serine hydrolase FSH [Penicillium expansum]KGO65075.1 Serine hydrolase FSH [Penicillium expansum]